MRYSLRLIKKCSEWASEEIENYFRKDDKKMDIAISNTSEFQKICNTIREIADNKNLLSEEELVNLTNERILNLFKKADKTPGPAKNFFKTELKCGKYNTLPSVMSTQYLMYVVLISSNGLKLGQAI